MSEATCQRRIQRLRSSRIIDKEVALVDPLKGLRPITVLLEIDLTHHATGYQVSFEARMASIPEVSQCYATTGRSDYVLVLNVANIQDYDSLAEKLLATDPAIKRYAATIVRRRVKFETLVEL